MRHEAGVTEAGRCRQAGGRGGEVDQVERGPKKARGRRYAAAHDKLGPDAYQPSILVHAPLGWEEDIRGVLEKAIDNKVLVDGWNLSDDEC